MKKKLTLVDIIIILAVLIVGIIGISMIPKSVQNNTKTISYRVLVADQPVEIADSIKEADNVLLSASSNTFGKVTGVEIKNAEESNFDLKSEKFVNSAVDFRSDIYLTLEANVIEHDWGFELGDQKVRIGEKQDITAPTYGLSGYIVEIID